MPKIDTTKIENYGSMTAEEKVAALEALEFPELDVDGFVKKELYDKASADVAKYKKQLRDNLSEAERKEKDRLEEQEKKDEELKSLRKEVAVNKYKSKYLALGYDETSAEEAANAAYDGDFDKVFELQSKNAEAVRKSIESEVMKRTPPPNNGKSDTKMSLAEAMAYKNEHPEADIKDLI